MRVEDLTTKLSRSLRRQHHGTNSLPGSHLYPTPECPSNLEGGRGGGEDGVTNKVAPCNTTVRPEH